MPVSRFRGAEASSLRREPRLPTQTPALDGGMPEVGVELRVRTPVPEPLEHAASQGAAHPVVHDRFGSEGQGARPPPAPATRGRPPRARPRRTRRTRATRSQVARCIAMLPLRAYGRYPIAVGNRSASGVKTPARVRASLIRVTSTLPPTRSASFRASVRRSIQSGRTSSSASQKSRRSPRDLPDTGVPRVPGPRPVPGGHHAQVGQPVGVRPRDRGCAVGAGVVDDEDLERQRGPLGTPTPRAASSTS